MTNSVEDINTWTKYQAHGSVDLDKLHDPSSDHLECTHLIRHLNIHSPEDKLPLSKDRAKVKGYKVHRFVQEKGDLVVTWPGAYHSGINLGCNLNEAGAIGMGMEQWAGAIGKMEELGECGCGFGGEERRKKRGALDFEKGLKNWNLVA